MEQMGSAIIQPYHSISADEMITPTLPSVSAKMCKKTPGNWTSMMRILVQTDTTHIRLEIFFIEGILIGIMRRFLETNNPLLRDFFCSMLFESVFSQWSQ